MIFQGKCLQYKRLNRDSIFSSDDLSSNLAQKSVCGGMTTMSAQIISLLLILILADFSVPADFAKCFCPLKIFSAVGLRH